MKTKKDNNNGSWGKKLLLAISTVTVFGGYVADMNRTHMFNPKWTPHSKFHDAISILTGTFLGSAGLFFLLKKYGGKKQSLKMGTIAPGLFWASMLGAIAFPKAKGLESEFPERVPRVGNVYLNEPKFAALMLFLLSVGYLNESNYDERINMVHPSLEI